MIRPRRGSTREAVFVSLCAVFAKSKRGGGGGPSMPTMEMGDMGSPKLKVLAVLVVVGLFNLSYWYRLDHESKAIAVRMEVAKSEAIVTSWIWSRDFQKNIPTKK